MLQRLYGDEVNNCINFTHTGNIMKKYDWRSSFIRNGRGHDDGMAGSGGAAERAQSGHSRRPERHPQIGDNQCVKAFLDKELNVDTKLQLFRLFRGDPGPAGGKVDVVLSMSPPSYASVYLNNPKAVDIVGIAVDDQR